MFKFINKLRRGRGNGELEPMKEFIPRMIKESFCSHDWNCYSTSSKQTSDKNHIYTEGYRWSNCKKCGAGKEEQFKEKTIKPDWVKLCEKIARNTHPLINKK